MGQLAPEVPGFADPIAEHFLERAWQLRLEQARAQLPSPPYSGWPTRGVIVFNQLRTVVLDRAIAAAQPIEQLVILGAGLDGRAYRLLLEQTIVYEVDHPDTQALKRDRAQDLKPLARDLRYVAVDFEHDDLGERLAAAGHDRSRPTFWLWEGVIFYLTAQQVEKTLRALTELSAPGSRVAATYFSRARWTVRQRLTVLLFGLMSGEPFRSAFDPEELAELAFAAGWHTLSDTGLQEWKQQFIPDRPLEAKDVRIQHVERIWIGERR
jgi:methyltransferase (TIGR00027 family)